MSEQPAPRPGPGRHEGARHLLVGLVLATTGLAGLTAILVPMRSAVSLGSVVLLYLVVVVATAVVGGLTPSLLAAVASDLVVNFFFVPPYHTFSVDQRDNLITLVVYVTVAITVSLAMDLAARQRAVAARSSIEARLLARISAEPVREGSSQALLEQIRDALHMTAAALVEADADNAERVVAIAGHELTGTPGLSIPAGDHLTLRVEGPPIFAPNPRFLTQLATAAARTLHAERLAAQAAHARELAEVDRLRTALLAAVGHDLRTPLAAIKAGVSSVRDPDLDLSDEQQSELLATVEESADAMAGLVENLLAMSRLQAGALSVHTCPVAVDEVVATALLRQSGGIAVEVDVPDDLPLANADPGLLERVIANLLANAHHASPAGGTVQVTGRGRDGRVELRIIDHGPGIPASDRDRMFAPFQRLDDRTTREGLGLGLAIAHGFTRAMNGSLTAEDTAGGGLTMTITLPAAP